jgi:hypothetical protein
LRKGTGTAGIKPTSEENEKKEATQKAASFFAIKLNLKQNLI